MKEIRYGRRKRGKRLLLGSLAGILILAALIVFGLFRVQEVVVTGNQSFSAKQIKDAVMKDGMCRNTLYLVWKFQDKDRAAGALPFLNDIEVQMESPFKVQIKVYEKPEIGYLQTGGKYVYFDREGMVVETSDSIHEGVPLLTGLSVADATLYETLKLTQDGLLDTVLTLTRGLNQEQLVPDEIRFSTSDEIILIFGKTKALLGKSDNLEDKVAALASIYPKIAGQEGNLHMQNYSLAAQTVTFRQGEDEETLGVEGQTGDTSAQNGDSQNPDGTEESETETETETETQEENVSTYQEGDGTFATDADGNQYYTDAAGNVTYDCGQYNYTDDNGEIITDGYGYIDPYTGAYIIG